MIFIKVVDLFPDIFHYEIFAEIKLNRSSGSGASGETILRVSMPSAPDSGPFPLIKSESDTT